MQGLQDNANIPAFLVKLWKMVNDPSTDHLITFNQAGNTFIIQNEAQFWYELLPIYYKHNNMSSFVRQLNMYGFHKISNLENSGIAVSADKDDSQNIQFYHPYFQRDEPEKLKYIKRKGAKPQDVQGFIRHDDLTKVLTDVKQLRGRQSNVDSQLSAMKQENAVLWRELAMLRQKHMKQQQIVNKLIQFLVTLVQPTASPRMGVSVKRRLPLMLDESPTKKARGTKNSRQQNDAGPTIHELDTEVAHSPEQLLGEAASSEEDIPMINSPVTPGSQIPQDFAASQQIASPVIASQQSAPNADSTSWDKPDYVVVEDLTNKLQKRSRTVKKAFLNPNNCDTLIGSSNVNSLGEKTIGNVTKQSNDKQIDNALAHPNMQVATKNPALTISNCTPRADDGFSEDLDMHLDNTQNELDQLKDILNGCNTFDANTLLGLFAESDPDFGIRGTLQNKENPAGETANPLVSENQVAPASNFIDFSELFDDDLSNEEVSLEPATLNTASDLSEQSVTLDTPLIMKNEPRFPSNA